MNKLVTGLLVSSLALGGFTLANAESEYYGKGEHKGKYCKDGKGHASRIERMADEIGLSESQLKQVRDIQEKYRPKHQALHDKMRTNRQQLRDVMQADTIDQAKVSTLAQQVGDFKAEKIVLRAQRRSEINKVLNKEQREKVKEMFKNHGRYHDHHGYGKRHHD